MIYEKIAEKVPADSREGLSEKLVDIILRSKKEQKMPRDLADSLLNQWRQDSLSNERGLAVLFQGAILLDLEKTVTFLEQDEKLLDVARMMQEIK